jgi:hypothetical protein
MMIKVNNGFGETWKKAAVTYLRYYPSSYLEGLNKTKKTSIRIIGVPVEI